MPIAFDSVALIHYLEDREPYSDLLAGIFEEPLLTKVISTVSITEVLTIPFVQQGRGVAEDVLQSIKEIQGIRIFPFDEAVSIEAAEVRASLRLKLPDAAIVATARVTQCGALIGNDRQWRNLPLGIPYFYLDDFVEGGT